MTNKNEPLSHKDRREKDYHEHTDAKRRWSVATSNYEEHEKYLKLSYSDLISWVLRTRAFVVFVIFKNTVDI
jgi:hypothetical protein